MTVSLNQPTRSTNIMAEGTGTARSHMYKHQDIVDWLTEEGHITPKSTQAETIAAAFANRNAYRATERYRDLVEAHKGDAEAAAAERAAERAAKPAKAAKATKAAVKAPAKAAAKKASKASDSPFD